MRRLFKKSTHEDDGEEFIIYEPTVRKKGKDVVMVSDNYKRRSRENMGSLEGVFTVRKRKRR